MKVYVQQGRERIGSRWKVVYSEKKGRGKEEGLYSEGKGRGGGGWLQDQNRTRHLNFII